MRFLRPAIVLCLVGVSFSAASPAAQSLPPATLTLGVQPPAGMLASAFTVDRDRNVYYAGTTTDPAFPTTAGAYSRRCGVDGQCGQQFFSRRLSDMVVVKLGRDGQIQLSTFLGGDGQLTARFVALGPDGSVYVAGEFAESRLIAGPQRMPFANPSVPSCGQNDRFVARLDPERFSLIYWTCIQGSTPVPAPITMFGLAVDGKGSAIVGGYVNNANFPLVGALPPFQRRPGLHGYIKKLLANGDIAFSTIYGGSEFDTLWSLAVDRGGNIYIAGDSQSGDLPATRPFQSTRNGPTDGFLAKVDPDGRTLLYSTYLGGSSTDVIWGVAVDNNDEAWVVGDTHSVDFPTTSDATRSTSLCAGDPGCAQRNPSAFAARFDAVGRLRYSTLIGPNSFNPGNPGGARLNDVRIGAQNELYLFGGSAPVMTPVRPLTTPPCVEFCGQALIIGPLGDVRFTSAIPSGNSVLSFEGPEARGRWALGPDGELYFLRSAFPFTSSELIVVK